MRLTDPQMQKVPEVLSPGLVVFSIEFYRLRLRGMSWNRFMQEKKYDSYRYGLVKARWNPIWNEVFDERTLLRPAQGVHSGRESLMRAAEGIQSGGGRRRIYMLTVDEDTDVEPPSPKRGEIPSPSSMYGVAEQCRRPLRFGPDTNFGQQDGRLIKDIEREVLALTSKPILFLSCAWFRLGFLKLYYQADPDQIRREWEAYGLIPSIELLRPVE